jgi:nitrate/nitrite-specific signal transduction histidine kinase
VLTTTSAHHKWRKALMPESGYVPTVNEVQEFIEIAGDFANPIELVREAISNSFDTKAKCMTISFSVGRESGEDVLVIYLEDDGTGMNDQTLSHSST